MDRERLRAYLQVACAGLGFDIGEIWWTSTESGSSTVAAIEDDSKNGAVVPTGHKRLRFVQLYTSKSFENLRSHLVNPPETEGSSGFRPSNGGANSDNLEKHVLSPRLVEAISNSAQVVWANSMKQEGLTGRSDIRLQTAVGMPVAIDGNGNMCVVVMFSPNNFQSTDDAMDYLNSISQSATSTSIPCLLPVLDPGMAGIDQCSPSFKDRQSMITHHSANSLGEGVTARFLGEGVTARFVSFGCAEAQPKAVVAAADATSDPVASSEPEVHCEHELWTAPKDTFGIPMLPSFAELRNVTPEESIDVFDEASYGVWTTIMDTLTESEQGFDNGQIYDPQQDLPTDDTLVDAVANAENDKSSGKELKTSTVHMSESQKARLEEFCSAFLGMSVFDLADVWVPTQPMDSLLHVTSVPSTDSNDLLRSFMLDSENVRIKCWNGAVGRAFSSGNPVWSANPNVFVDTSRASAFQRLKIQTVLAVPVFSKEKTPACVVSCYAFVRSGSVPFVLRFVQQALRLLWDGLEKVQPHESLGRKLWRDVAPADLGEMAADVEMQQHFMTKKRPHALVSEIDRRGGPAQENIGENPAAENSLSTQLQAITLPNGDTVTVPLQLQEAVHEATAVPQISVESVQTHLNDAVRSVRAVVPFDRHVATNSEGTKRAHVMGPISGTGHSPLPRPRAFPTHVVSSSVAKNISTTAEQQQASVDRSTLGLTALTMAHEQAIKTVALHQAQVQLAAAHPTSQPPPLMVFPTPATTREQFCIPVSATSGVTISAASSKQCRIQGCNDPAVARRPYCVKHSGNRLCEQEGCAKCAQGSTRFCIAHGGGRRCTFPGCDKGARDKFFCAAHGGGKRCKTDGCSKSAVGGSQLCTAHGGGRRCAVEGCDKSAQSSTKFCVKHGGGKKCAREGCEKVARGRTFFCASHGGGVRCKLEGCNRVAIGKLVLCRAHGGGARPKKADNGGASSPTSARGSPPLNQREENVGAAKMAVDYSMRSV